MPFACLSIPPRHNDLSVALESISRPLKLRMGMEKAVAKRSESNAKKEEPLLPSVARQEDGAVQAFLDRYSGLVWSLARRLTPTRADAEDAVQDIFVDLWRSAERFDSSLSSESTFVAMVARRRLIDRLNKANRRIRPAGDTALEAAPGVRDDQKMNVSEEAHEAAAAFKELGDQQRRVLTLAIQYGQTHTQIAEITGMPLGTVKTLIRRGLMKVRETLEEASSRAAEVSS